MTPDKTLCDRRWLSLLTWLIILCVMFADGCSKKEEKAGRVARTDDSPVVAKIGNGAVTLSDLKHYISDKSGAKLRGVTREMLDQWLDERVLEEVLYQEALRLGLDQQPEMQRDIRQMLTSRLMDDFMKKEVWSKEIEDAELQTYYDEHWSEFNRPEQVRIADVFIAIPENATNAQKAELREKAETVLSQAIALQTERFGFGNLVRDYSDTPKNYRKGDTGFFDEQGHPIGLDKALADAAFALQRVGSISDNVIESSDGYHIIMLTGKRSGVNIPLENVRQQLSQRIRREASEKAREAYLTGLRAKAVIKVDDEAMNRLAEELPSQKGAERGSASKMEVPHGSAGPPGLPDR